MDMLDILNHVEKLILTEDLLPDLASWKTKKIDYTPPVVDRIFRDWIFYGVQYRIYLHRIYPCERAFFHPHPWPSAIRVIGAPGSEYEMGVGYGTGGRHEAPPIACTLRLPPGSTYQMSDPNGWHYVRVHHIPSVSLMVSGPVWDRDAPRTERHKFRELDADEAESLRLAVTTHYRS